MQPHLDLAQTIIKTQLAQLLGDMVLLLLISICYPRIQNNDTPGGFSQQLIRHTINETNVHIRVLGEPQVDFSESLPEKCERRGWGEVMVNESSSVSIWYLFHIQASTSSQSKI